MVGRARGPVPGIRFRAAVATVACLVLPLFTRLPLGAQEPGNVVAGVVLDASSGAPISGALVSVGERGPRAIADANGRFRLANVPSGTQRVRVQRFGYRDLELSLPVTEATQTVDLRMQVDPIALEGLTVTGGAEVAVGGRVLNATTGEPVPWTEVSLTRDAVRDLGRAAADEQGIFSIGEVRTGPYLLRVERIGYESQYLSVDVAAPPEPVEVQLRPDSALLAGLAVFDVQLRSRRSGSGSAAQSYGEDRLRHSSQRGMRRFLENEALLPLMPCGARAVNNCRDIRGRMYEPRVYIDELPAAGLEELDSYDPSELYRVDVFVCSPADLRGGWEVRVYTYRYVDRQMKRRRQLFPSCFTM